MYKSVNQVQYNWILCPNTIYQPLGGRRGLERRGFSLLGKANLSGGFTVASEKVTTSHLPWWKGKSASGCFPAQHVDNWYAPFEPLSETY